MFKRITILILFVFSANVLFAQFPIKIEVNSDGSISESPVTKEGVKYIITITGTYSMWPQFEDCHGADAGYVYDVPQEEIDNLRWPPEYIEVGGFKIELVKLPHWVGDPKVWSIPPEEISTPMFKMSFRDYKGFRIDGEPIPNTGFQELTHRYQIEKIGTGNPFIFQILDSNRSIIEERTVPRYEDNCGFLTIDIEEVIVNNDDDDEEFDISVGNVDFRRNNDGKIDGRKIEVSIEIEDSTEIDGSKNILEDIPIDNIGIIYDGKIICDIDSIICNERTEPVSIGLLIDRTESMGGPISEEDMTQRMSASKEALKNFVEVLLDEDEAFVMSFSEDTRMDQTWTNDKTLLKDAIDGLEPDALTAVWGAINTAIDTLSLSDDPNRFLVVLSDGGNTFPPEWDESQVLIKAQSKNIKIFIVALGFSQLQIDQDGRAKLEQVAEVSGGKIFDVYNSEQLNTVYENLSEELTTEEDCFIYFSADSCEPGKEGWIRIIYAPNDSTIVTEVIKYKCPDEPNSVFWEIKSEYKDVENLNIFPNPTDSKIFIDFDSQKAENIIIKIVDLNGKEILNSDLGWIDIGKNSFEFDVSKLAQGSYQILFISNESIIAKKILIVK